MARAKRTKTTKKSPRAKRGERGGKQPSKLVQEVKGVLLAGVLVYVLISIRGLDTGIVGRWIAAITTYLFGFGGSLVVSLFFFEAFRIFRCRPWKMTPKRLGLFLLTLVFLTAIHLKILPVAALEVIPLSWQEVSLPVGTFTGGGLIGAILTFLGLRLFDVVGLYVVLGALTLVGLILTLDKPMRQFIGRCFVAGYKLARGLVYGIGYLFWWLVQSIQNLIDAAFASHEVGDVEDPAKPQVAETRRRRSKEQAKEKAKLRREAAAATEPAISINAYEGPEESVEINSRPRQTGEEEYSLPPLDLLLPPEKPEGRTAKNELVQMGKLLEKTLANFGIEAKVVHIDCGPVITRYELQPAPGIKVSRIVNLADDICLSLAAADIRIEAPIPGKAAVGIEVPNKKQEMVRISEVISTADFYNPKLKLPLVLGKGVAGETQVVDLATMPHLLIAGATGSGKSVCINNFIVSLLYRLRPDELRILMVDPKRVELAVYDGIPHLLSPVITDPKKAAAALKWVVEEMENRYELFANAGVRNIEKYNEYIEAKKKEKAAGPALSEDGSEAAEKKNEELTLPYVVVIIDELADLMMVASSDVEDAICRLAQMARAAGIHLVVATQRPSVDVITGLIKANIPARIAFAVSSQVDSRTILDTGGAERLIGKGDMLYLSPSSSKTLRVQGAFISDKEIEAVANFWKKQGKPEYEKVISPKGLEESSADEPDDELFEDAVRLVINSGQASISLLQRRFRIGHSRAARLMDMMELKGIVGPYQGSKPREVLVNQIDEVDL
ncbi:MAG: DNA translocase FtsK 4TM domain-containing protein [Firmicutes bacterium]|nr:DNA translocase FtsK 4TM domain-containing protein [Bacillota bacterium]